MPPNIAQFPLGDKMSPGREPLRYIRVKKHLWSEDVGVIWAWSFTGHVSLGSLSVVLASLPAEWGYKHSK